MLTVNCVPRMQLSEMKNWRKMRRIKLQQTKQLPETRTRKTQKVNFEYSLHSSVLVQLLSSGYYLHGVCLQIGKP